MARVIHRRVLTAAEALGRRRISPMRRLGLIGWLSVAVAVVWLGNTLRPLLGWGALDQPNWFEIANFVVAALGHAALLALPAGLLFGFPAARRRNRWLFRGVTLLALMQLLGPAMGALQQWTMDAGIYDPGAPGFSATGMAITLLTVASAIVSLAAVWALSDGLAAAGARPRLIAVVAIAAAGIGAQVVFIVPYVLDNQVNLLGSYGLDLLRSCLSLGTIGLWFVVALRLLVGSVAGLVPRRAWVAAGVGGVALMAEYLANTGIMFVGGVGDLLVTVQAVLGLLSSAVWVLLLLALALGLGRDTNHAAGERWRIPRYARRRRRRHGVAGAA
jgi:hypothetical protein